jgi:PAS domain S-box-containing protein
LSFIFRRSPPKTADARELADALQKAQWLSKAVCVKWKSSIGRPPGFHGRLHGSWSNADFRRPAYDAVRSPRGARLLVSPAQAATAEEMLIAARLTPDDGRLLVFHLNVSALLSSIVKSIQSGKTGYAWVIDPEGRFIYHPNPDFFGRDAFLVRDEKFPDISNERIHFIQKEKMLKGEQGTGWYYSGWTAATRTDQETDRLLPIQISESPRFWSVAVVAPQSEVEDALRQGSFRLLLLQGLVVLAVILGASAIIWLRTAGQRSGGQGPGEDERPGKSEEYRSLVESAEDFIFTVDREGRFQSMNTFTANFFGGPPEIFIGQHIASAVPQPQAERQAKLIARVYSSGKSIREEFELPMGGRSAWISATSCRQDETGMSGPSRIARDITETRTCSASW